MNAPTQQQTLNVKLGGGSSFQYLNVDLGPGAAIETEPGAMAAMEPGIDLKTKLNAGLFGALLLKFFGSESLFRNVFINRTPNTQRIMLTQATPGQIQVEELNQSTLYLQPGAYIASTPGVSMRISWAGFSSWLGGEGLLRLRMSGSGYVWYGSYGAIIEKEVNGSFVVDSGHLLSYPPTIKLSVRLSGGIFSSFFGGEGLVLKLTGQGKIKLQTRSLSGLGSWINPKLI